jgi:hypothetical protein
MNLTHSELQQRRLAPRIRNDTIVSPEARLDGCGPDILSGKFTDRDIGPKENISSFLELPSHFKYQYTLRYFPTAHDSHNNHSQTGLPNEKNVCFLRYELSSHTHAVDLSLKGLKCNFCL